MSLPATLGVGALGMLNQKKSNGSMESLAQQQLAQQGGLIKRQEDSYDTLMGIAKSADAAGAFDPTKRLNLMQGQVDYDRKNAMMSEAGAAGALGYRAGDSVPLDTMNATRGSFDMQMRELANQIMNQSLANKIAAYSAANPSSLNSAMGTLGENARFAIGREGSLGGLLMQLLPYLTGKQQPANKGTASAQAYGGSDTTGSTDTTQGGIDLGGGVTGEGMMGNANPAGAGGTGGPAPARAFQAPMPSPSDGGSAPIPQTVSLRPRFRAPMALGFNA